MEKLLITDISTSVGQHLKEKFWNQFEIYSLSLDIKNSVEVDEYIGNIRPNYVIHICQQYGIKNRYEQDTHGIKSILGTINLLNSCKKIDNFKLLTFHSVYDGQNLIWDMSKYICEKIIEDSAVPYCILKLPTIYGNYERPHLFNIGQEIPDTVRFNAQSRHFNIEDLIWEFKNRRKIIVEKNSSFKLLFIDDLLNLYESIFLNVFNYQNKKITVPYKDECDLITLYETIDIDFRNRWNVMFDILDKDVIQSSIYNSNHTTDWSPSIDLKRGLKILLERIDLFDKECNGL
jgi:nucleoside-diphosphate-sugar epimerase